MEMQLTNRMQSLLDGINNQVIKQKSLVNQQQMISKSITDFKAKAEKEKQEVDVLENALALLTKISDNTVKDNYKFIEDNINAALKRVFPDRLREIKLNEYMRGAYPQLDSLGFSVT